MTITTTPAAVPPAVEDARSRYARARQAFQAGEITRDEIGRALDECMNTLTELSVTHRPELDCPPWCNDHEFFWGEDTEEGYSNHNRRVEVLGEYTLEVTEGDEHLQEGRPVVYPDRIEWMHIPEAREYAHAILSACDEVEGIGASGRAARRLYERLSGQLIEVEAMQAACEALGFDLVDIVTGGED